LLELTACAKKLRKGQQSRRPDKAKVYYGIPMAMTKTATKEVSENGAGKVNSYRDFPSTIHKPAAQQLFICPGIALIIFQTL
jgi:hypothetical protein